MNKTHTQVVPYYELSEEHKEKLFPKPKFSVVENSSAFGNAYKRSTKSEVKERMLKAFNRPQYHYILKDNGKVTYKKISLIKRFLLWCLSKYE